MNENKLFDDISRTLASSMPRRQAMRQIVRGLAGAALVSLFGAEAGWAAPKDCPPGQPACGTTGTLCCPNGHVCCGSGTTAVCCNPSQGCDGTKCKSSVSPSVVVSDGK
jgi:hypothetical protein